MRRPAGTMLVVLALLGLGVVPAGAAQRLETIETPSVNVDPAHAVFNGPPPSVLKANVLLPDGYDGARPFPVLFLLHGVGDSYDTWAKPANGDVVNTLKGLPAIVVMPEAGKGFYTNWFNGGRRGDPGWERYYLDELIPQVEQRFRVAPGRRNHAIAGLSMGGFGTAYLAGQRPDYFGSASVFSGFVQHQRPEVDAGLTAVGGVSYTDIFGPMDGAYATGHNPTRIPENLRSTRVFVAVGDGTATPGVESSPSAIAGGGAVEFDLRQQNDEFVAALRGAGVDVDYRPGQGVHDWPYWRADLRAAVQHGLFESVPEDPARWVYSTVARRGRMWSLTYAFAADPPQVATFARDGDRLKAAGSGTVTVAGAATGCGFTAALPFTHPMPADLCGHLVVRVRPRVVRAGRTTRVRVSVTGLRDDGTRVRPAGAHIRIGACSATTGATGVARIPCHFGTHPGLHTVRVTTPGLRAGRARIRAR